MDNGQFDKLREKLHDIEMPVDADIWQGIESSLRIRRIRRAFLYASSAAAVILAALFIFISGPQNLDTVSLLAEQAVLKQNNAMQQLKEAVAVPAEEMLQTIQGGLLADRTETAVEKAPAEQQIASRQTLPANVATATDETPANKAITEPKENRKEQTARNTNDFEGYLAESNDAKRQGYSLAFFSGILPGSSASVTGTMIRATSAGAGNLSQSYSVEQISDTKYSLPLNLGVQFQFPAGNNMALGIGANYTMLRSRYDCLINKKKYNVKQTLHYIGIPVNVYGLIADRNNFSFYINAGAALEKGIKAVYDLKSYDSSEHNTADIDGVQFSVNAGMGVEYKFSNTVRLYLEPNIVYYVNSEVPRSIRTDQPLQIKAEMGFRFRF